MVFVRGGGSIVIVTLHGYLVCVKPQDPVLSKRSHLETDFMGVDKMTFHFKLGKPFLPFQQLMGVLPEASKHLVPPPYRVSPLRPSGVLVFHSLL